MKNQAFTLIELLVVVLIIGILASIAVPQYQLAVAKSRAVQLQLRLNTLYKAAKVYEMQSGSWPNDVRLLDLDITKEAAEFKANNYVTSADHMAAFYEDESSCGTHKSPVGNKSVWCINDDISIDITYIINNSTERRACTGESSLGTKICDSLDL